MAKPKKQGGPKQELSPMAARKKARRDLLAAKSPIRRAKKADAQKRRRDSPTEAKGKDWDHKNGRWRHQIKTGVMTV